MWRRFFFSFLSVFKKISLCLISEFNLIEKQAKFFFHYCSKPYNHKEFENVQLCFYFSPFSYLLFTLHFLGKSLKKIQLYGQPESNDTQIFCICQINQHLMNRIWNRSQKKEELTVFTVQVGCHTHCSGISRESW